MATFKVAFSIRKKFKRKKVSAEIAIALISLFYVKIQQLANRSTTTRAFVFLASFAEFTIIKYLKQEDDDNLSICVDEHGPYVTLWKEHDAAIAKGEVPYRLLSWNCFYCPNLITPAAVTRDKEIWQSHMIMR